MRTVAALVSRRGDDENARVFTGRNRADQCRIGGTGGKFAARNIDNVRTSMQSFKYGSG